MRRIEGYKADDLYGYMHMDSYDKAAPTSERRLYNGVWSRWSDYVTTSDLDLYDYNNIVGVSGDGTYMLVNLVNNTLNVKSKNNEQEISFSLTRK